MSSYHQKWGSPPPMRGKVRAVHILRCNGGITPAYAGKSLRRNLVKQLNLGSPPPMRGKDTSGGILISCRRITPAYAGKSLDMLGTGYRNRDHPRLCGEKFLTVDKTPLVLGSPPPMRGKVHDMQSHICYMEDHPRLCGEKFQTV